jgi:hypothetical protein
MENDINHRADEYDPVTEVASLAATCPVWMKIHLLSFCMKISGNPDYAIQIFEAIDTATLDEVGEYNRLNLYGQLMASVFVNSGLQTSDVNLSLTRLYRGIFGMFCNAFGINRRREIPIEQRTKELVFVFTSQMLNLNHAPTKTLLDRCYILQKYCGKKVFIINTAMFMASKGEAPFYKSVNGQYRREYLSSDHILKWKDEQFDFMQCKDDMPNPDTITELVKLLNEKKPYYILNIGGDDICTDLCGMFVPEITISTVFSDVATSCCKYQIVGGDISDEGRKKLDILNVDEENVIRTLFTFSFKEQTHTYTRAELGIPEDSFVLQVVGGRLDGEVDDEFLGILDGSMDVNERIFVAFMGTFETFDRKARKYKNLAPKAIYLGYCEDALAVTECCDLYVNPRRRGGGSSAAEALYKGLPVVTLAYGDVSSAVGEEFRVTDYKSMEEKIVRYSLDKAYYDEMSEIGKKRAGLLLDSNASFGTAIREIERKL